MKKKFALLLALLLLFSAFTACSENANQTPDGEDEQVEVKDDILRVVLPSAARTLDPAAATDSYSAMFIYAAYDQLVGFGTTTDAQGRQVADPEKIVGSLAKSWEVSEDGLEYIFYLDETATFANGDPVDAKAVIYSLDRVKNSPYSSFLFALTNIEVMEEVDAHTVRFQLEKPCTILYKLLQMHLLSIVNPNELGGISDIDAYLAGNTAGSGAYEVTRWDTATEAILTAREDYWKGAAPNSTVQVQFIAEAANRVLLADKGDADLVLDIPPKDVAGLEANANITLGEYESNKINYLALNNDVKPFDNKLVRQAINYVMPRESMVDDILYGKAAVMHYVVPAAMPGYLENPDRNYDYDLEKALDLMAEAGYEDGFSFTLTVSNSNADGQDAAVLIQSELAKLNIDVNIDQMEMTQYLETIKAGNIEAAICTYTAFVNDPGYFFGNTLHSQGEYNYAHLNNKEVDALWDEAESTNDTALRLENYAKAQEIVFDEAPWAALYESRTILVVGEDVESYLHYPDAAFRFYHIKK